MGDCACGCDGVPKRAGSRGVGLRLENVTVRLGGAAVVDGVSASIPAGRVTALAGPNCAGKSTLLDAILNFRSHEGRVLFLRADGRPLDRPPRIGYVPQRFAFDRDMPMTPVELIASGHQRLPLWFGPRRRERNRALALLAAVGAGHAADRPLGALSGGELQRVLLATALRRDPEVLILDEPGAGVDAAGEELFCEVLEHLRGENGFTQVMVSHNLALVAAHAEQAILMNRRVIARGDPCDALAPEHLQAAYGAHMGAMSACSRHFPPGKNLEAMKLGPFDDL